MSSLTQERIDGLRRAPAGYTGLSGVHYHRISEAENAALCDMAEKLLVVRQCCEDWIHSEDTSELKKYAAEYVLSIIDGDQPKDHYKDTFF